MGPVKRKERGDRREGDVVGVLPQENFEVSNGELLGRRGMGLGGSGGGAGEEQMAFLPLGRVVGLISSSLVWVAGMLKREEVQSSHCGAKIEHLAGTEGTIQRSQTYAVLMGEIGEGKSPGVNSAIERAGEGGTVLDSLIGLKGSRAIDETELKESPAKPRTGETGLGRSKLPVKDKAGDRGLGGVSRAVRWWKESERGLTGELEGTVRPAQIRQ